MLQSRTGVTHGQLPMSLVLILSSALILITTTMMYNESYAAVVGPYIPSPQDKSVLLVVNVNNIPFSNIKSEIVLTVSTFEGFGQQQIIVPRSTTEAAVFTLPIKPPPENKADLCIVSIESFNATSYRFLCERIIVNAMATQPIVNIDYRNLTSISVRTVSSS